MVAVVDNDITPRIFAQGIIDILDFSAIFKGVGRNMFHVISHNYGCKGGAVFKCGEFNARDVITDFDPFKRSAINKCLGADLGYAIGYYYFFEVSAILERKHTD